LSRFPYLVPFSLLIYSSFLSLPILLSAPRSPERVAYHLLPILDDLLKPSQHELPSTAFTNEGKKVATALTYFKMGTPAGEWAHDKQNTALAATPVDFGTWADFKTTFKKHFIPAESELQAITAIYNTPMHQWEFNEWYQEWLTYATRAGVDERTKMYTFRRMLPRALHEKIIALSPQPTTLADLVEKARDFDRSWRLFQGPAFQGQRGRSLKARATTTQDDTQINLFTGDEPTLNRAPRGPLSKAEQEKRFKENHCFYCGKVGHRATNCFLKKGKTTKPYDPKARAVKTEDKKPEEDASPAYDVQTQVSRFYSDINDYDILRPKSAPVNEDF
jgi:hypothetical protein